MRIGFIGLGTMGGPMAANLARKGHALAVFDAVPAAVERFAEPCRRARSPAEAAREADAVITMLPSSAEVRAVMQGPDGALAAMPRGALFIDMSTVSAADSMALAAELRAAGMRVVDAPVGRTPDDARKGTLLVMAGGDKADIEAAMPIFTAVADTIHHVGPQGSGIRLKLVNNYMTMVGMALAAEALTLAAKCGLDREQVVAVLRSTTAGKGPININYPRKVLAGDITPDFPLRMGLKDISLALALGAELGAPLSLGGAARELFALAKSWGRADQDCTAMLLLLEDVARVPHASAKTT